VPVRAAESRCVLSFKFTNGLQVFLQGVHLTVALKITPDMGDEV